MGRFTGYDIMHNLNPDNSNRMQQPDWSASKTGARRRVDHMYDAIMGGSLAGTRTAKLLVIAVDPDTGEVVAGKTEV